MVIAFGLTVLALLFARYAHVAGSVCRCWNRRPADRPKKVAVTLSDCVLIRTSPLRCSKRTQSGRPWPTPWTRSTAWLGSAGIHFAGMLGAEKNRSPGHCLQPNSHLVHD